MIDKSTYITKEEMNMVEEHIGKQVFDLKKMLSDKSNFKIKKVDVSIIKEVDENVDE